MAEWGAYLAVAHRHVHDGSSAGEQGAPFQWGHDYRHVLFTITPELRVARYSGSRCLSRAAHRAPSSRLRTEERVSMPIGAVLGAAVGAGNALLGHARDRGLGDQLDLLRAEQQPLFDD